MKKIFLLLVGACMAGAVMAQVVARDESALVYYSPKTDVVLNFNYTVERQEAGIYAQYAESMLGVKEWVKETRTTHRLHDVRITTHTSTDYSRPHKVSANAGIPMLLNINAKGLLVGYNVPLDKSEKKAFPKHPQEKAKEAAQLAVPYMENVLKAATPLAQAHAVVQQIMHIRETRMFLLSGEVEKEPADGKAMQLVLDELDKQEQALTELFVGKTVRSTETKRVVFDPAEAAQTMWFFSEENGFTEAENIDADTIRVQVEMHPQRYLPSTPDEMKQKKKSVELSPIVYNLPGNADVKVVYKDNALGERNIPIAQIGVDVPLTKELFKSVDLPTILFNEQTGNVESITK